MPVDFASAKRAERADGRPTPCLTTCPGASPVLSSCDASTLHGLAQTTLSFLESQVVTNVRNSAFVLPLDRTAVQLMQYSFNNVVFSDISIPKTFKVRVVDATAGAGVVNLTDVVLTFSVV